MTVAMRAPATIRKRDGRVVTFDAAKIEVALTKCFTAFDREPETPIEELAMRATNIASARWSEPTVEQVQDVVEMVLQAAGEYEAAKHYILYRAKHTEERAARPIPDEVRQAFETDATYFPTQAQALVYYLNYSRWSEERQRRETWVETATRATDFLRELSYGRFEEDVYRRILDGIIGMRAMPSMRLMAMAGPAARRNNIAIYNCSALGVSCLEAFVEALIISMNGCGVGFSVERKFVEQLSRIARQRSGPKDLMVVEDSSDGWAEALLCGLRHWFDGEDVEFDLSMVRPAGTPLRTKGGRASGPEPLRRMLGLIRSKILSKQGGVLSSLDAHDMMCWVGDAVVMGGMRRSAMLSLFDSDDDAMRLSKAPGFDRENAQRWNANNSAVWEEGVTQQQFVSRFIEMVESGNGEPGIFNRRVANAMRPQRREPYDFLTNPCSEILLRDMEFCNLSIAVARKDDTTESLAEKVRSAAIIGTIQSLAVHFPGLRPQWERNCEEERLLGVDVTGHYDSPIARDPQVQRMLRRTAVETNEWAAGLLQIRRSAAVTCVKPSGNSAQLLDVSSGVHPRYARYYIRRYRVSAASPIYRVLWDAGVPLSPENGQSAENTVTWVASFPVKAPEGAVTRSDISAIEHCEYWLSVRKNYTEHKPSATIYYGPDEIIDLMKWVWDHRDEVDGITFLPRYDARLDQAPYEEITESEYEHMAATFPKIDFSKIVRYEMEDRTTASQEMACSAGVCETI